MKAIVKWLKALAKDKTRLIEYGIYALSIIFFFVNAFYVTYPDEFVNIMAGKYINWGKIPYKDFFDHHLPFAWYLSAIILWFSNGSYVWFRFWFAFLVIVSFFGLGLYLKKTNRGLFNYYLIFLLIYPILSVYFWLHLFIADALAAWFFALVFWLLISATYQKEQNLKVLNIVSLLTFCFLFSSMTYIYLVLVLYLWQFYLLVRQNFSWPRLGRFLLVAALPYLVYLLFLLLTGSLKDFYIANFVYNTSLYIDIPNYTKGRLFNPFKFGFTLIYNFQQNYLPLLTKVKTLDLYLRWELVAALSTLLLLLIFLIENPILFGLFFLLLSFSSPRSTFVDLGETNYQAGVFIVLGLISTLLVFWRYRKVKVELEYVEIFKKVGVAVLFIIFLFDSLFLLKNTYDKWFQRYTQKMPGINDLSSTAVFLDEVLTKNDTFWVGPYEPNEVFFVKGPRPPGKYITLLPQFREDDYFKNSFLDQFRSHMPALIIYKHEASIFGTPSLEFGKFFTDWMSDKYTSIENIKGLSILKSPSSFNFRTDLYLLNSERPQLLSVLRDKGYIQ